MAKRITAYQSNDGMLFHTAAECDAHNALQARTEKVAKLLAELGLTDAVGIATKDTEDETKLNVTPLPAS
jgi:hypothetical protein